MLVSRLPDEILEQVFLENELTKQDLCAVALTCRSFSKTVLVSLYYNIRVCILDTRYRYLMRTLVERPQLGFHVRRAVLCEDFESTEVVYCEQLFKAINDILKLIPAIQYLELQYILLSYGSFNLFDNPLVHVRTVVIFCWLGPAFYDAMKAMLLPRIKKLILELDPDLDEAGEPQEFQESAPEMLPQHSSTLNSLTVTCWDYEILESNLIKVPRVLQTLSALHYIDDISPDRFIRALRPLYTTLVNLNLHQHPDHGILRDDMETLGNFSCFTCLKFLSVDEQFCFKEYIGSGHLEEKCGLFNRLPFTLERLEVYFDYLEEGEGTDEDPRRQINNFNFGFPWILELAEQKMASFPCLSGVCFTFSTLHEPEKLGKVPDGLCQAYKSAKIDLVLTRPNDPLKRFGMLNRDNLF